ncbi:MAG: DUF4382 domain-containing protein [Dysgonamonadaceae bacterium]|jgi:hypothetical protein|nr:DUF4382 domain-containing protein [Dysgonamonadaceae bacterium]
MQQLRFFAFSFCVFFFLIGCGDEDAASSSRLRISLTDAASLSLKEFSLDIQKIEASVKDPLSGSEAEWVTLDYVPKTYNLLNYTNGKSERLVDQFFPSGELLNLRIVFGSGSYLKLADKPSEKVALKVPQDLQTDGLIIDLDTAATVYSSTICSIVFDVNVLQSIKEVSGEFHFNPAIRAFPETFGGSLKGYVTPVDALAYVMITQGSRRFVSWPEASDGMFLFTGLKYGEWTINIVPTEANNLYQAVELTDTIETGKVLNLNTIKLTTKSITDNGTGDES